MSDVPEGYKKTEVGVIPMDWEVRAFCEVSFMKGRIGWQGLKQSEFTMNPDDPFLITGMNFKDGEIRWDEVYHVLEDRFQMAKDIQLKKGDVLITKDGTIGKLLYVKEIPYPGKATLNSHLLVFRPIGNSYDPLYLYYNLSSPFFTNHIELNKSGTTFFGISQEAVSKYKIPLPPTRIEQTAIATALYDADALTSRLEKLIAKKRNIKQGAMQELLKPKEGWEVKKLGEIFKFLNTANNSRADLAESGDVEYIHYGDIHTRWNCFLDCSKNELPFIDKAKVNSVPFLENGDLVIADASEDYEGLATCVEIKNIGKRKIVAGLHTLLLRADKNIIADGFKGYLRNYHGVKDTLIRLSTGVSVFGISKTNLKEVEVSIPPTVEEQNHIVQILSDMDAEIEALEKKLEKYKAVTQGMMQELLTGKTRLIKEKKA